MDTDLRVSGTIWGQLKYALLVPVFFFVFIIVYNPFSFKQEFVMGGKTWTFHLLMVSCIMIAVLALSRLVFHFLYRGLHFKWWHYVVWCLCEVLAISFFFALYLALFRLSDSPVPYFTALSQCIKIDVLTLVYPYLFSILFRIIINEKADIEDASRVPEEALLKLYDEHHRLKLTIDPAAIVYVAADANYINVHYLENGREKVFPVRNSMKSFEEAARRHGIVRCHRSFYVNPKHVRLLSRGKDGIIYTLFNVEQMDKVPVSKMYYDELARLL
ncbi:MAG: LytTR family DNA-binding domain-containing protein [Candidatus Cryptobacteroides sp.]